LLLLLEIGAGLDCAGLLKVLGMLSGLWLFDGLGMLLVKGLAGC